MMPIRGCGSEVLEDVLRAAERAYLRACDAHTKSAHEAVWARVYLQQAQLEQCREECARLLVRNEHLEAVIESERVSVRGGA